MGNYESVSLKDIVIAEQQDDGNRENGVVLLSCNYCSSQYNEKRVPRTLLCGHSLCLICTEKILEIDKKCPECNRAQVVNNISDMKVNYPLLRIAGMNHDGISKLHSDKIPSFFNNRIINDQAEKGYRCSIHSGPLSFFCWSCRAWACHDCLVIHHPFLPRGSCKILEFNEGMELIKSERMNIANEILKAVDDIKRTFDFETGIHDFCLKYCSDDRQSHIYLTEQTYIHLEKARTNIIDIVEEVRKSVNESAESGNSPQDLIDSCKKLKECKSGLEGHIEKTNDYKARVLKLMIEHLRLDLKTLVQGPSPVYAILGKGEQSRWAEIVLRENRMLLYSLQEGTPPNTGIDVPFEYVDKLIPMDRTTVFFEISKENEGDKDETMEGEIIYIWNWEVGYPLGQQVKLMCTGEKGFSYKGSLFYKHDKKNVYGGDYENNVGTGGRPVVQRLPEPDDGDSESILARGTLIGDCVSTRFRLLLAAQKECSNLIIGHVIGGKRLLTSLSKITPSKKLLIKQCGISLPMNVRSQEQIVTGSYWEDE